MVRFAGNLDAVTTDASAPLPYHHGNLRAVAVAAAVEEVETVGVAGVSMRRIARRAGVSHAALAYQFGDKTGIFTAVAADGFRLAAEMIGSAATGAAGFLLGGMKYVEFGITHPGHFEVMFRPNLYRGDDPDLASARDAAFDLLYGSARASLAAGSEQVTDEEVVGLVVAGWSLTHGLATLALTANLRDRVGDDLASFAPTLINGVVTLGNLIRREGKNLVTT